MTAGVTEGVWLGKILVVGVMSFMDNPLQKVHFLLSLPKVSFSYISPFIKKRKEIN